MCGEVCEIAPLALISRKVITTQTLIFLGGIGSVAPDNHADFSIGRRYQLNYSEEIRRGVGAVAPRAGAHGPDEQEEFQEVGSEISSLLDKTKEIIA